LTAPAPWVEDSRVPGATPANSPFGADDLALLDKLAVRVVEMRLETPALLFLETVRPLNFVASQAMVFFAPMVRAFLDATAYDRLTRILERRESIEELVKRIEAAAAARGR
jgi:hypothetical protein